MGISSNPMLQAESDCQRIEFIKNDLAMCSTFTTLATMKYEAGNWNSAERSLGHAEGNVRGTAAVSFRSNLFQTFYQRAVTGFHGGIGRTA